MKRPATTRLVARTVALLALVLVAVLAPISSASAYLHTSVSGRPGAVQAYQTVGTHFQVACGAAGYVNCYAPGLSIHGPVVYRSPASTGKQYVTVRYTVFRWTGSRWVYETARDFSGTIHAGYTRAALPAWNVLPNTAGHKKTSFSIVWSNVNGRILASSAVAMNGNDYACGTRFTFKCNASTGSVAVWTP